MSRSTFVGRALGSSTVPGMACLAILAVSALSTAYDLWKIARFALGQLTEPAVDSDFLNLYAGAALQLHNPSETYQLEAQLRVQQTLTARDSALVPFYLPPHAALLVGWLGWLPYGVAYLIWFAIGVSCLALAAYWIAPRWTRVYPLIWVCLGLMFLPVTLALAQGQTSALMLLGFAACVRALDGADRREWPVLLGALCWTLKPQLSPLLMLALLGARRWRPLALASTIVLGLTAIAVLRLGSSGLTEYQNVARAKLAEVVWADPVFLIGPTLLHASRWWLGVNPVALSVAAALVLLVLVAIGFLWRQGLAGGEARLLQLAALPIGAILCAPYALVYELTLWLPSFWLLWRYTATRRAARTTLLWLAAAVLVAGNLGVAEPRSGGADVAVLPGLALLAVIVGLFQFRRSTGTIDAEQLHKSCPRGSE